MIPITPGVARFVRARRAALRGEREGLHEFRAAARRLRVWLKLSGLRAVEDDLRWLCRETSALRDLEVLDEVLTPAARDQLRPEARRRAFAALRSRRADGVIDALHALPSLSPRRARARVRRWEKALRRNTLKDDDDVHALRKLVRRVRYAREWLGDDTSELRRMQQLLGALCDLAALSRLVTS